MPEVEYNLILVTLSFIVAVAGSFTALFLATQIPLAKTSAELFGTVSMAALALGGGGIWSMHFLGMLAYDMNMPVTYDVGLTAASLLLAVVVSGIGLFIVGRGTSGAMKLILGGTITGLGVAGMHYTGMIAMKMPATISYNMSLFYASLIIAVVAATAALWLAFNQRGTLQRLVSALVMGVAVCGMHYTGMAALILTPTGTGMRAVVNNNYPMALLIFIFTIVTMGVLLLISTFNSSNREQNFA